METTTLFSMVTWNGSLWRGLSGALVVVTADYDYDHVEADVCIQSTYIQNVAWGRRRAIGRT